MGKDKYSTIHYHNYLRLDDILDAQSLRSEELGEPAHDEMLFIIVHQAYELWFKQILHELRACLSDFSRENVDEKSISKSLYHLRRVVKIFRLIIKQIDILETMSPLDFLDFREYLFPASGFQSIQFRKIEIALGLEPKKRITYNGKPYHHAYHPDEKAEIQKLQEQDSLKDLICKWLERTPFLSFEGFDFLPAYKGAVGKMLSRESAQIEKSDYLSEEEKKMRLRMLGSTETYFKAVLSEEHHNELREEGELSFSHKATVAALMIRLYRDEPILHMPDALLTCIMEIDELFTTWRFRHSQMVKRMLGSKVGTGGSSGHSYLRKTADKHEIFADLYHVSTLLIPRSELPALPKDLKKNLGFYYSDL